MHGAQKSQSARNDDIEILRAYAVLLVLYEHFPAVTGFAAAEKIRHFMNGWLATL
jgi:peptidoglycan/LPS O-acetylase OafA/YrhL